MNIIKELQRVMKSVGRFPRHQDLVEMNEFRLRNAIIQSKKPISEYAKEMGVETAKPRGYWTDDKIVDEIQKIIKENNGWPSIETLNKKYSYIVQACSRKRKSIKSYREVLGKDFHPSKSTERECAYCSQKFIPLIDSNWKRQRFCCKECKVDFYRIKQNERNAKRIKQPKICPICQKIFVPRKTTKQKYCETSCYNNFRKRMDKALKRSLEAIGIPKSSASKKLLGYSPSELLECLQAHQNWSKVKNENWHIDHIYPIKAFVDYGVLDAAIICSLDNLQPMLATENTKKRDEYDPIAFEKWLNTIVCWRFF